MMKFKRWEYSSRHGSILDCYPMSEEEENKLNSNLYDKWIKANDVQDIEFEEVKTEIKTNNNDKRTNLELGLQIYTGGSVESIRKIS